MEKLPESINGERQLLLKLAARRLLGAESHYDSLLLRLIDSFLASLNTHGERLIWPPEFNHTLPRPELAADNKPKQLELPMLYCRAHTTNPNLKLSHCPYCSQPRQTLSYH